MKIKRNDFPNFFFQRFSGYSESTIPNSGKIEETAKNWVLAKMKNCKFERVL